MSKGTRARAALAGFTVMALVVGACSASDDETTSAIAESEVGSTTPPQDAGADDEQAAADDTTATTEPPVEGSTGSGDPAAADGRDEKSRVARTINDLGAAEEPVGTPEVEAAEFDVPNDGAIEQDFGIDQWTFTAEAGQILAIDVLAIDHDCRQDLDLNLIAPGGERGHALWVGNGGCVVQGPYLLEEAGEYRIEFAGGDGATIPNRTGAYRFVPMFLTEVDIAPLSFDQPNDGEIGEVFGVDRWSFNGAAGDLAVFDVLSIGNGDDCRQDLSYILEDPIGERISDTDLWVGNGGCIAQGPYELPADGEYVIEFYGGNGATIDSTTGSYRFVPMWLTQRSEEAVSPGSRIDGSIEQQFGSERWTFEATAGQVLTVEVHEISDDCRQDLTMTITDPFGEELGSQWIGNGGCKLYEPWELELDGTYVIEMAGGSGATIENNTGAYTFSFTVT